MKINVSTAAHPDVFAEIDDGDLERVSRYRWTATRRRKTLYVRGIVEGKDTLLHRFITDAPRGLCVDHRDGNPLNNQRSNLRICTRGENTTFAVESGVYDHLDKGGVHVVKRKLADGTVRLHYYDRKTRERLPNPNG